MNKSQFPAKIMAKAILEMIQNNTVDELLALAKQSHPDANITREQIQKEIDDIKKTIETDEG